MALWNVLTPPDEPRRALERAVLVKEGFAWGAALPGPLGFLWFAWHRLWLAALVALGLAAVVAVGGSLLGFSAGMQVLAQALLAGLVGYEANEVRRASLARSGWRDHGPVSGTARGEAERRFLESAMSGGLDPSPPLPRDVPPPPRRQGDAMSDGASGGVTGLFPNPGGVA